MCNLKVAVYIEFSNSSVSFRFTNDVIFGPPTEENAAVLREDDVWNQESEKLLSQITVDERYHILKIFASKNTSDRPRFIHTQFKSLDKSLDIISLTSLT